MTATDEPIITSALRTFFKVIFGLIGLCVGMIPVLLFFGMLAGMGEEELPRSTEISVLAGPTGQRTPLKNDSSLILRIDIKGIIGSEELSGASIERLLQESREGELAGDRVKALLLVINSPGGVATEADKIYRHLKRYKELYDVPIIAYVDGISFSGGMYVAAAADYILTSETSLVGSIGVVLGPIFNFSGAMDQYGIKATTITVGSSKDTFNPTRPWAENEGEDVKATAKAVYERFVDVMVEGRKELDRDRLVNEFGAQVFTAQQGFEYGLVDVVGSDLWEALAFTAQEAGLMDDDYQVVRLNQRMWLGPLLRSESPLLTGQIRHEIVLPPALDPQCNNQLFYYYHNPMGSLPRT